MPDTRSTLSRSGHTSWALGLSSHGPCGNLCGPSLQKGSGACAVAPSGLFSTKALRFPLNPISPGSWRKKLFPKGLSLKRKAITCHFA